MNAKKPVYLRWWYFALAALFIVSGLSYLGTDVTVGLITALIGVAMLGLTFYKKKHPCATSAAKSSVGPALSFEAAGVGYYLDNLRSVGEASRSFDISEEEFLKKYSGGKTQYAYYFNKCVGALVPEPQNPHDPNAIMVTLDGVCVGHVPANLCSQVHELLKQSPIVKISPRGGPRRFVKDGVVYREDRAFNIYVDITV